MQDHTLLGISGSLRQASLNRLLVREAARVYDAGRYVEADLDLPLFNEDTEQAQGIPPEVRTLSDQIAAADAVVISGPEYNKSISGVLKNALDWVSRTEGAPWRHKPVAIMSATAGRAGGERTQFALRLCLVAFQPRLLLGPELMVARAKAEFDDRGRLVNERYQKTLSDLMAALKAEVARVRESAG